MFNGFHEIWRESEGFYLIAFILSHLGNNEKLKYFSVDDYSGRSSSYSKKVKSEELRQYFATVLPEFDDERVRDFDIKKLLSWYDILVSNGITDFEEEMKPTEGDNVDDRQNME